MKVQVVANAHIQITLFGPASLTVLFRRQVTGTRVTAGRAETAVDLKNRNYKTKAFACSRQADPIQQVLRFSVG